MKMRVNSDYYNTNVNNKRTNNIQKDFDKHKEAEKKMASADLNDGYSISISEESEAYREYASRMDSILERIENGDTLSQKDSKWLEGEIDSYLSGNYSNPGYFKFQRQDTFENLVNTKKERDRRLKELLDNLEDDKLAANYENLVKLKTELELKNQSELIEKFSDSLHEDSSEESEHDSQIYDESYFTDSFIEKYIDKEFQKIEKSTSKNIVQSIKENPDED